MKEEAVQVKNRVQLFGNIGKMPAIRTTASGRKMATFSIATSEVYYRAGQPEFETQWHFAVAWGKVATDIESSIKPGTKVTIEGKLSNRNYIDKNGQKKYITQVIVDKFEVFNND